MDSRRPAEAAPSAEAAAFVRFCYHRRRAGWPELYDEMCAVASRRLYNGWGFNELADRGIGFSLFETPALALLAREIVREESERRSRGLVRASVAGDGSAPGAARAFDALSADPVERGESADPGPVKVLGLAGAAIA
jgi:hypothetical protein